MIQAAPTSLSLLGNEELGLTVEPVSSHLCFLSAPGVCQERFMEFWNSAFPLARLGAAGRDPELEKGFGSPGWTEQRGRGHRKSCERIQGLLSQDRIHRSEGCRENGRGWWLVDDLGGVSQPEVILC